MIKSFKRLNLSLIVALGVAVCSCSNEASTPINGETGEFNAVISFEGSADVTCAGSSAVPTTSWSNINNAQVFLIESGVVKYSKTISIPATGQFNEIWTDVPVGTYTVTVVANTQSGTDDILTSLDGNLTAASATVWDSHNVRQKNVSDLAIYLKDGSFPSFVSYTGRTAKQSPSEIFMGSVENISVSTSGPATATVALKREVAMMRVRIKQVLSSDAGDVNFAHENASIMYHRIPKGMTILEGSTGGVMTGSSDADATVVAATGTGTFLTADPSYGQVIDADYTMWRDIIVLPNSDNRNVTSLSTDREYTIVISGYAPAGHKLANGETMPSAGPVYWSGRLSDSFAPNKIREVNIEVKTGGSTELPGIREEGSLTITINEPLDWDSNIDETVIEL